MAVYVVTELGNTIDFGAIGHAEIVQNVRTIISTVTGTVPLDRAFPGIENPIDLPVPAAQAKLSASVFQAIQKHEPRVKVLSIEYEQTTAEVMNGKIAPVVTIEVV